MFVIRETTQIRRNSGKWFLLCLVFSIMSHSVLLFVFQQEEQKEKNKEHRNILSVTRIHLEHQRQTSGHFHISLLYAHSRYWPLVPHFVDGLLGNGHEVLV